MAAVQGDDGDIFVYDGNQPVPDGVKRARIHKSVKIVRARAFHKRYQLISVEFHDGVEIIEKEAFNYCVSLRGPIQLLGVKIVKKFAFNDCRELTDVEFGDQLETIEQFAFYCCCSLKMIKIRSVRTVGSEAFGFCRRLSDVECGELLDEIHQRSFHSCEELKRIALPLKGGMIFHEAFKYCKSLSTVDLIGGIHQTVASLHMESWRNEMNNEINRINQVLPTSFRGDKTWEVRQGLRRVTNRLNHYKDEHKALLKEATTLLELALWKANRDNNNGGEGEREGVRTLAEVESAMAAMRVTSGADVVIKNVLPFLALK